MGEAWGKPAGPRRGGVLQTLACLGWASCAKAQLGFAFPLAPIQRSAVVGEDGCCPSGTSFISRRYPWVKRSLLLLLLLLLLAAAAYGKSAQLNLLP